VNWYFPSGGTFIWKAQSQGFRPCDPLIPEVMFLEGKSKKISSEASPEA